MNLALDAQHVGKDVCASCHLEQTRGHAQTGHAKALAPGGDKGDWAFGSGTHAITWVSKAHPGHYREHGESWFRATNKLAITPGHSNAEGVLYRVFDPGAQILRCFSCHSTGGVRLAGRDEIQPAELGVQCEVCHGPGQAHVEAKGAKYRIENPARYRASAINEQCGACHRQPGADTNWQDPWNVRHQPVYLAQSRCFLASEEKLSCFTCHRPHQPLSASNYDTACQSCHAKPAHKAALPASATCTSCHMPAVNPIPEIGFANHWIGIYEKGNRLRPRR